MFGTNVFAKLSEMSHVVATIAANLLVQSTLVITAGMIAGWLFRKRGAAVQSSILRMTLVAAWLCPLVSVSTGLFGLSGYRLTLPDGRVAAETAAENRIGNELASITRTARTTRTAGTTTSGQRDVLQRLDLNRAETAHAKERVAQHNTVAEVSHVELPREFSTNVKSSLAIDVRWGPSTLVYVLLTLVWLALGCMLFIRVLVANVLLWRWRRQALTAPDAVVLRCVAMADALQVAVPSVLVSPHAHTPCLVGLCRPAILLPTGMQDVSDEVLIHELAHLLRGDCAWNLVSRLTTALFPLQPLLWSLCHRMQEAADEVCDDRVVQQSTNRLEYAAELLKLAERFQADWSAANAAVGVMLFKSRLGKRVQRVLDSSRALSIETGLLSLSLILICGLSGVVLAGAIGAPRKPAATERDSAESKKPQDAKVTTPAAPSAEKESTAEKKSLITIQGRVLDPNKNAIANVNVLVVRQQFGNHLSDDNSIVAQAATNEQGQFTVSCPTIDDASSAFGNPGPRPFYSITAARSGYGVAWEPVDARHPQTKDVELRLPVEKIIESRVVDLEGQPIAGVTVRVLSIQAPRPDAHLDDWVKAAAKNPTNVGLETRAAANPQKREKIAPFPIGKFLFVGDLPSFASCQTDNNGHFRLQSVGNDHMVTLQFSGPSIATTWCSAVNREMPTVPFPTGDPRFRNQVCYGSRFDYVAEPGRIVRGVVQDAETKKPIGNVVVDVTQIGGSMLWIGNEFMQGPTDEQGRFELSGLPLAGSHSLRAQPDAEQPYFRTEFEVPVVDGQQPIELTCELRRAVWIHGRLIDRKTSQPIAGWVSYYPYVSNAHAEHYSNFDLHITSMGEEDRYTVGPDGSFRIPAIEGRGIMVGAAQNAGAYRIASGAESIEELKNANGGKRVYELATVELANAVRELDIAAGANEVAYDLELVPASRHRIALVDPEENPLLGVQATGYLVDSFLARNPVLPEAPTQTEAFLDVLGLDAGPPRTMVLLQTERNLGLITVLDGAQPDKLPKSLRLQPCGRIVGRILKNDGSPLRRRWLHLSATGAETVYGFGADGVVATTRQAKWPIGWVEPDDAGHFEFPSVPPGSSYTIVIEGDEFATPLITPGAKIEVGDLRLK